MNIIYFQQLLLYCNKLEFTRTNKTKGQKLSDYAHITF